MTNEIYKFIFNLTNYVFFLSMILYNLININNKFKNYVI